jgi:glycine hydroxymethyltransferase
MQASGLRIGTSALATRGLGPEDFQEVGGVLAEALLAEELADVGADLSQRVRAVVERYPLYEGLTTGAPAISLSAS